ncbi:hypothetical protein BGZ94_005800 [Podila epigama]|nr:hypothetical protein BGZ94_005800 [Podila epigama]
MTDCVNAFDNCHNICLPDLPPPQQQPSALPPISVTPTPTEAPKTDDGLQYEEDDDPTQSAPLLPGDDDEDYGDDGGY